MTFISVLLVSLVSFGKAEKITVDLGAGCDFDTVEDV